MDVITIESSAFKHIIQRIVNLESMVLELVKLHKQPKEEASSNKYPEFISREQAMTDFHLSDTAVDNRIKKYNISRLQSGGKKLLNRAEFIKSLHEKQPIPKVINRRQPLKENPKSLTPGLTPSLKKAC